MIHEDFEQAILTALNELTNSPARGRGLGEAAKFSGDLQELLNRSLKFPAALLVYSGGPCREINRRAGIYEQDVEYRVVLVVRNYSGVTASAFGSSAREGYYDLLDRVLTALSNQNWNLSAAEPLRWAGDELLIYQKDRVLYSINFKTTLRVEVSA